MLFTNRHAAVAAGLSLLLVSSPLFAQRVPHNQGHPPGPPLEPEEALARITARGELSIDAGETLRWRYRLVVHDGSTR